MNKRKIENTLKVCVVGEFGLIGYKIYDLIKNTVVFGGIIPTWLWVLIVISPFAAPLTKGTLKLVDVLKPTPKTNKLQAMIEDWNDENN